MDKSVIITLIKESKAQDQFGVWQTLQKERDVFAQVDSVTRNEFFEGGRNGLNPEFKFTMVESDYDYERTIKYNGNTYGVYRTYLGRNDTIELYAERKGGTNG